jgi:polyphosphate kinase 2
MIHPTRSSGIGLRDAAGFEPVLMTRRAEDYELVGADYSAGLEQHAARLGLQVRQRKSGRAVLAGRDGKDIEPWREGYPYPQLLRRKPYESRKQSLQIELLKLQQSVKASGRRLLIVFEGRDAAGKGGTIRCFTENLNPRGTRVVALEKPTAHEQGNNYLCRFLPHLPAPGEIVLLDRSWYNRAGVEHVLGFCQPAEYQQFLQDAPEFERMLTGDGIDLIKLWFSVTRVEQLRRFIDRQLDPVKRWKLSQVDLASLSRWDDYTRAEEVLFRHTELPNAPWTVVKSNDKRRARLEAMRYVLSLFDYLGKRAEVVGLADPLIVGSPELVAQPPHRAGRAAASVSGQAHDTVDDLPYAQDQQNDCEQGTRVAG